MVKPAEVVRHFLRLEATHPKYAGRQDELLAWCKLSDAEVLDRVRGFAGERDDINPALVYTVGVRNDTRHSQVSTWTRERVMCEDIYTCGISSCMRTDIDAVRGNLLEFSYCCNKYPEFRPLLPLTEISSIVILVDHQKPDRNGQYEVIDGVHRLAALCCAGIQDVEAYVAHME